MQTGATTTSSQVVHALPPAPNRYRADLSLQALLRRHLEGEAREWLDPLLDLGGDDAAHRLDELAALADRHPPVLHARDRFGNRVDRLEFHPAYEELRRASYGRGLIGHYHDPELRALLGAGREVAKFAQGYLFAQAEQGLYCPICLTDGTAFLVERYGSDDQKARWLPHLVSTRMEDLWEGAMFLTERAGGSDVGATETVARRAPDGTWRLEGEKWFCSNARADLAMVLARPEGAGPGTRGLGLFAMRLRRDDGTPNGLRLDRLKDKLGTRSMATAELVLEDAVAEPLGDLSRGFVQMADMLNLSRLYNSVAALAVARRALTDALAWCRTRRAFGRPLVGFPAVRETLAGRAVELEGAMHLVFGALARRGRVLVGPSGPDDEALLRLLTPLAKYSTARLAVATATEAMELLGGNGYVEDWPLARLTRDALVLPLWEGAANILVLDVFRAMRRDHADQAFFREVGRHGHLAEATHQLQASLPGIAAEVAERGGSPHAGRWCDRALQVLQAAWLADAAADEGSGIATAGDREGTAGGRARAMAEAWWLRHFDPRRHDLVPPHSAFLQDGYEMLTD